jgi:hypothetical protein
LHLHVQLLFLKLFPLLLLLLLWVCLWDTPHTACVGQVLLPALTCTPGSLPAWRLRPFSARNSNQPANQTQPQVP